MMAADGGKVARRRAGDKGYTLAESIRAIPGAAKVIAEMGIEKVKRSMANRQRTVRGRNQTIDEYINAGENYSRGGKAKRMGYANGGGVSRGEAKRIAERTVGEHVRYPAPKGHKGLKA